MEPNPSQRSILADNIGIHFMNGGQDDIVIEWGEIEGVEAARVKWADGSTGLEIFIDDYTGVDFTFYNIDLDYDEVMASMEQHLVGFSRARAEAAGSWDEKRGTPRVWERDEAIQPFKLLSVEIDSREPSPEERVQMEVARQASIVTCENILGRPLDAAELACVNTGFKNGQIVGGIEPPLCDLLFGRQGDE